MTERREIPFARPSLTDVDREAVLCVLGGPILAHGPEATAFEDEFALAIGGGSAVSVSSCMAALHVASLWFGIGPGDEVILPAQTHVAAAHAVEVVGARPVFVDCDPATGNVTAERIAGAIGPRTKAISLVHYAGIPCDMPEIARLASERGLRVIEDCALALGARYDGQHVGLFGDVGCFSFYPVKHITTAEGGMLVTRHADAKPALGRLRAFGYDLGHTERAVPGAYDVIALGLNYRMSELHAALGRSQLRRLPEFLDRRRRNYELLRGLLDGHAGLRVIHDDDPRATSSHYCLILLIESDPTRRDAVVGRLRAVGVGTSVYYPRPVPLMEYYERRYGHRADAFPAASLISTGSIALPTGPHVTEDDVRYIAAQVHAAIRAEVA